MSGVKICPKCGKPNPPDSVYCQYCGARLEEGTQILQPTYAAPSPTPAPAPAPAPAAPAPQTPPPPPPQPPASGETEIMPMAAPQPVQATQPVIRPSTAPQVAELPIPYYLIFPDGKRIEVYEKNRVFGREDFEGLIPSEYLKYITRREKGGQFRIYCDVKDINTVICYIRDDFSTNPTYVNSVPIKGKGWIRLNDGDIISLAGFINVRFRFAVPIQPSTQPQVPSPPSS